MIYELHLPTWVLAALLVGTAACRANCLTDLLPAWLPACRLTSTWLICATLAYRLVCVSVCVCVYPTDTLKWSRFLGSFVRLSVQVSSKSLRGFINDVRQPFSLLSVEETLPVSAVLPFLSFFPLLLCVPLLLWLLLLYFPVYSAFFP